MFHEMFHGSANGSLDSHTQRVDVRGVIVLKRIQSPDFCTYRGTIDFMDAFLPDGGVVIYSLPPNVGDTLIAEVVDRNGEDVSDNVTFQWYADDEEIEGADEETLIVDSDLLGAALKVVVTAENGNTFESDPTDPVGVFTFEIESAEATKVNEITVKFADAVEAKNVTFVVKKGETTVATEAVKATDWSLDEKEVTIKTTANMTDGTYTVTATDSETKDTDSADFEVTKQHVDSIVILNETALTNRDANIKLAHKEAYAYYDVLDQYGQSMRASTSIQWSGSAKITADKATGKLTMKKNNEEAWVYNDKIYITGVYVKTGVSTSATLTVGTEQSLDSIEQVGFLKKGTTDIIDDLPADFKDGEYYLLFHALDQNGCPLKAEEVDEKDVTFVSDNVLVVKELTKFADNAITVAGTEYNGVFVTPGIKVAEGGEVTVTAIANKTGTKTDLNFMVGEDRVVVSFTLGAPAGVVADGDQNVVIPFEAIDDKGDKLTNFRALAKQEIFNTLSFNTSEGVLRLAELNDGTAKLTWSDKDMPWANANTTDGIDRPISLSVVVVGGEPNNEMIYVQDKRRPNAVSDVNMSEVYVEGAKIEFNLTENKDTDDFKFIDQYETVIGSNWGDDNGFFKAAAAGDLQGIDFNGYDFGIRITNAGSDKVFMDYANTRAWALDKKAVILFGDSAKYETSTEIQSAATNEGFKFEIVKFKAADGISIDKPEDWEAVSPTKFKGLTVVDITQVKNFQVGDLNMFYTGALEHGGNTVTGDGIIGKDNLDNLKATGSVAIDTPTNMPTSHKQTIKVTGTYNGKSVSIPGGYFKVTTTKGTMEDTNDDDALDATVAGKIYLSDLYDKTSANGTAKPAQDEVVATIYKIYDSYGYWTWSADKGIYADPYTTALAGNTALDKGLKAEQIKAANAKLDKDHQITTEAQFDAFMVGTKDVTTATNDLNAKNTAYTNAQTATTDAAKDFAIVGWTDIQRQEYYTFLNNLTPTTVVGNLTPTYLVNVTGGPQVETLAKAALTAYQDVIPTEATVDTLDLTSAEQTELGTLVQGVWDGTVDGTAPTYKDIANAKQADITAYLTALKAYVAAYDELDGLDDNEKKDINDLKANMKAGDDPAKTAADLTRKSYIGSETTAINNYLAAYQAELNTKKAVEDAKDALALAPAHDAAVAVANDIAEKKQQNADENFVHGAVYDTAKKDITFSDQAPAAKEIKGLKESYTFNPTGTDIKTFYDGTQKLGAYLKAKDGDLTVVDQYGVVMDAVLEYTVSNAVESKDGFAGNNFKVSDNGTQAPTISGAELGDTFDLVVSIQGTPIKATTKVTVGADTMASIENNMNNYTKKDGLKAILDAQRIAGLE